MLLFKCKCAYWVHHFAIIKNMKQACIFSYMSVLFYIYTWCWKYRSALTLGLAGQRVKVSDTPYYNHTFQQNVWKIILYIMEVFVWTWSESAPWLIGQISKMFIKGYYLQKYSNFVSYVFVCTVSWLIISIREGKN